MSKTLNLEDCVTFEIAQKLKEKGYPLLRVIKQNGNPIIYDLPKNHPNWQNCNAYYIPTISQVLKWLRDEKKLYVEPCILADADTDADGKVITEYTYWSFSITHIETGDMIYFEYEQHIDDKRFDSYEEAALAGIEYILNNLI